MASIGPISLRLAGAVVGQGGSSPLHPHPKPRYPPSMTKMTPIESEFATTEDAVAYNAWFRAKVERTSPPERQPAAPIALADLAADVQRRRAETGITDLPRNAGNRRTPSKRALLAAIEKSGGTW